MVDLGRPTADVPSRGYQLWVTDVVVVIVAGVFVAIRLVSRYLRSGIQVDDWTILAALVTDMSAAVGYGFGKHDWDITDEQEKKSLKVSIHIIIITIIITFNSSQNAALANGSGLAVDSGRSSAIQAGDLSG
ncbi:hypothetical protein TRV_07417 [Trichophyton verrucosum HKI 0517]|uniref:Rhodopsin domain-containing protein n=1 Tax=Trichophyton verrucosum (strain HKI 0517) TaxID=663202 RepID=D4DJP9_TRIVH|nr:uncharacterized protein TRV_07417 [Trichophyton verrucosum HKI 0517]EFE37927.1 hypothetical protein TRV_07417 [Trichophyton verrucosum HKI 0517]